MGKARGEGKSESRDGRAGDVHESRIAFPDDGHVVVGDVVPAETRPRRGQPLIQFAQNRLHLFSPDSCFKSAPPHARRMHRAIRRHLDIKEAGLRIRFEKCGGFGMHCEGKTPLLRAAPLRSSLCASAAPAARVCAAGWDGYYRSGERGQRRAWLITDTRWERFRDLLGTSGGLCDPAAGALCWPLVLLMGKRLGLVITLSSPEFKVARFSGRLFDCFQCRSPKVSNLWLRICGSRRLNGRVFRPLLL